MTTEPIPGLNFRGSFTFGDTSLFGPLSISLPSGEWTCLLGSSGVGKSTILRLILGLETGGTFTGTIQASDGLPINNRISYMAQSDLLLPWLDIRGNVIVGSRLRSEIPDMKKADRLIERVGLAKHKTKKPNALSGGMRQRVALARTLMEDQSIILLDEPFSALDASTRAEMQELANETLTGKTVLHVTHDPAEASRLAHQIIVMSAHSADIWKTPKSPPIRDNYAKETLACQSSLLKHLRSSTNEAA